MGLVHDHQPQGPATGCQQLRDVGVLVVGQSDDQVGGRHPVAGDLLVPLAAQHAGAVSQDQDALPACQDGFGHVEAHEGLAPTRAGGQHDVPLTGGEVSLDGVNGSALVQAGGGQGRLHVDSSGQ